MKKLLGIIFTIGFLLTSMRVGYTLSQQGFIDRMFTFKDQTKNREWKIIRLNVEGEKREFLITPVEMSDEVKESLKGQNLYLRWEVR